MVFYCLEGGAVERLRCSIWFAAIWFTAFYWGCGIFGGHLDSEQYGHHKSMLGGWIMVAKVNVISFSTNFGPVKSLFGWFFYKYNNIATIMRFQ